MSNLIVLKFGSSVLRSAEDLPNVVHEIYRYYREGYRVIAVVSALGGATEDLLRQAQALSSSPEPWATAELLATGERTSAALLGIALDRAGIPARVVNPREIGLEITGAPLDGQPVKVNASRVDQFLCQSPVLVVPGFFGTNDEGRTQLLGRGGSDFTAVFLAVALDARCRLVKDVDGVYESDPAQHHAHPHRFTQLGYEDALRVAGKLIQPKAVDYLRTHRARCEVAALALPYHTLIHPGPTERAAPLTADKRDVVMLGLGTVGFGVYQRLLANADRFRVIAILVRDPQKHELAGVPRKLLHTEPGALAELKPWLVIDALPGIEPSYTLIKRYLGLGIDVVSANKAVIARFGAQLLEVARASGSTLRYSAAVGGCTPMLEAVDRLSRLARIDSLEAVLNGTCNFLLETCALGVPLSDAIREAQRLGFAEADPTDDLSGRDAARKLAILARHAFGAEIFGAEIRLLDECVAETARDVMASGRRLRQIARVSQGRGQLSASVSIEPVTKDSLFYSLTGESNALTMNLAGGKTYALRGRGAGRWPTAESVISDVYEVVATTGRTLTPEAVDKVLPLAQALY